MFHPVTTDVVNSYSDSFIKWSTKELKQRHHPYEPLWRINKLLRVLLKSLSLLLKSEGQVLLSSVPKFILLGQGPAWNYHELACKPLVAQQMLSC